MVGLGRCTMCHTPINALGGNSASEAFQGGLIPMQDWYAPSLTSNKEAGLGEWSIDEIVDLLRNGVSHRGAVYGPMAEVTFDSLQYLNDADVRAMAIFLKGLAQGTPPGTEVSNHSWHRRAACCSISRPDSLPNALREHRHAADGRGMPPQYPPLAGNPSIQMQSAVNPIRMVLNGGFPGRHDRQPDALRHATLRLEGSPTTKWPQW